jgi:hypothetical protein
VKKIGLAVVLLCALAGGVVALYLMFSGPRMRTQPKIVPYQAVMPSLPAGVIPVTSGTSAVPSMESATQLGNPLPVARQTIENGRVYYSYYCVFCHDENGHGNGPVGRSYVPAPTDLTSSGVTKLSDGALYRAMLTGAGHEPVLGYVIDPKARWYLISYVRYLQTGRTDANGTGPGK